MASSRFNMSFLSSQHSAETLARGLELARGCSFSLASDPNPEMLQQELERLQELPYKFEMLEIPWVFLGHKSTIHNAQ